MRLISGPLSLFSGKVRIMLDEKRLPYVLDTVPFSRTAGYDPKPAEVVARNPKRQVPILVEDDGFTVYDSTLIGEYLDERAPEPALLPRGLRDRARCRQLEAAADEVLFPHVWTLITQVFYQRDPAGQDRAAMAAAADGIARHLAAVDAGVGDGPWLCGEQFTVADIGYLMTIEFASRLGVTPDPALSALAAWWARVAVRPSVVRERARLDEAAQAVLTAAA